MNSVGDPTLLLRWFDPYYRRIIFESKIILKSAGVIMYVVIFRAKTKVLDDEYSTMAKRMQELAYSYGCIQAVSAFENGLEITLSYWHDEAAILAWKNNSEHKIAQHIGRDRWYESYSIEICQVRRNYDFSAESDT